MVKRERNIHMHLLVSASERDLIREKMAQFGTKNMGAYLRKMAIDGFIINLEVKEVQELSSLLRRYNANLNQIAKRVNETSRIYDADISDIQEQQGDLLRQFQSVLEKLSAL